MPTVTLRRGSKGCTSPLPGHRRMRMHLSEGLAQHTIYMGYDSVHRGCSLMDALYCRRCL
jgi:hypothetical protein